jgi:localization factor PodJL
MATPLKSSAKAPRKSAVKPARVAKTLAAKPVAKRKSPAKLNVVAKKSVAKAASVKPQSRDTLVTLRSHVDDIEKRLKRANSLTRTSVRALKTSYEVLEGDTRTEELTGHIENLSDRLTSMIEQTRQDVGHDLRIVLSDPRLETLSGALTKANQRLTAAEHQQAEAINSINAHIAKLATVVDARIQREERQRQKGEALLTSRMDSIERDSASAIKSIGENILRVSEDVTEKAQTLKGEIAEQALNRQQDYQEHKHEIAQRIEALEDEQRNQLPAFERNIEKLSTRLEALESNMSAFEKISELTASSSSFDIAPQISGEERDTKPPSPSDDAFSALELENKQEVAMPEQSAQPIEPVLKSEAVQPGQPFAPVEYVGDAESEQNDEVFSPRAYVPGGQSEGHGNPQILDLQAEAQTPPTAIEIEPERLNTAKLDNEPHIYTAPSTENLAAEPQAYTEQLTYEQEPPPMPIAPPYTELPPVPATSETPEIQIMEPSMESVRPGAEPLVKSAKGKKRKSKRRKKSGGNNGNNNGGGHGMIRKAALFGGVAIVALFAYRAIAPKIFGTDDNDQQRTQITKTEQVNQVANSRPENLIETERLAFETTEPVGDYSDTMTAPDLGDTGTQARTGQRQTLEAAAADGNAIAQFQLGLSHLEAGRNADAVRLIRLSANQGQAAAQYRLAKLYEAGIGVKVNGKTAKDLLSRSADAGNRIAMHDLGHYYATGADGTSPDLPQAVKWFSMAAERGVLDSQFNLAVLYQGGSGVPLSLEEAYVWYAIAGVQGDKMASQRSEAVALELSENQLANARSRVKAFAPKPINNSANGIFKNLPWVSRKESIARPSDYRGVKGAQQMLSSLGYPVGTPDGSLGPNTRNAIISFERANGMPETGRVNAALIERLQMAVGV